MKFVRNRFFLAAVCLVLATALMVFYAGSFAASKKTIQAYKANAAIPKGIVITDTMLSPVDISGTGLQGLITDKEKIIGETTAGDLAAGQLIFAGNLQESSENQNLEQLLDGSRVAYSITVGSLAAGVSGKLIPNDIVSVYISKEGSSLLPPELTYVPVLYATTSEGKEQGEEEDGKTATVTLLVTPAQALILNQHEYTSDTHLALVYRGNPETANQFIETQMQALEKTKTTGGGVAHGE